MRIPRDISDHIDEYEKTLNECDAPDSIKEILTAFDKTKAVYDARRQLSEKITHLVLSLHKALMIFIDDKIEKEALDLNYRINVENKNLEDYQFERLTMNQAWKIWKSHHDKLHYPNKVPSWFSQEIKNHFPCLRITFQKKTYKTKKSFPGNNNVFRKFMVTMCRNIIIYDMTYINDPAKSTSDEESLQLNNKEIGNVSYQYWYQYLFQISGKDLLAIKDPFSDLTEQVIDKSDLSIISINNDMSSLELQEVIFRVTGKSREKLCRGYMYYVSDIGDKVMDRISLIFNHRNVPVIMFKIFSVDQQTIFTNEIQSNNRLYKNVLPVLLDKFKDESYKYISAIRYDYHYNWNASFFTECSKSLLLWKVEGEPRRSYANSEKYVFCECINYAVLDDKLRQYLVYRGLFTNKKGIEIYNILTKGANFQVDAKIFHEYKLTAVSVRKLVNTSLLIANQYDEEDRQWFDCINLTFAIPSKDGSMHSFDIKRSEYEDGLYDDFEEFLMTTFRHMNV